MQVGKYLFYQLPHISLSNAAAYFLPLNGKLHKRTNTHSYVHAAMYVCVSCYKCMYFRIPLLFLLRLLLFIWCCAFNLA